MNGPLLEHFEMDPTVLAIELDAAWTAAHLHDEEVARLRVEVAALRRRHGRLLTAFRPLRMAVGLYKSDADIAMAAKEAVRGYNRAIEQGAA